MLHYSFDKEGVSGVVTDSSGQNHHGHAKALREAIRAALTAEEPRP